MNVFNNKESGFQLLVTSAVHHKFQFIFIFTITFLIFISYALTAEQIYRGEVLIEIGEVIVSSETENGKGIVIKSLEQRDDLQEALLRLVNRGRPEDRAIYIAQPFGKSNLLRVRCEGSNKKLIKENLQNAIRIVVNRSLDRASFLKQAKLFIRPSEVVGEIEITKNPIRPDKVVVISIGVLVSMMLAFFYVGLLI